MWTAFDEIGTAIYADQAQLRAISATGEPRAPLKKVVELEMRRKRIMNEVSMQLTHIESQIASLEEEDCCGLYVLQLRSAPQCAHSHSWYTKSPRRWLVSHSVRQ